MTPRRKGDLSTPHLLFHPSGRAGRLQFWYAFVLMTLLFVVAMFAASLDAVSAFSPYARPILVGTASLAWVLVLGNVLAKRVRDTGVPGLAAWTAALLLVMALGVLFFHDRLGVTRFAAVTATQAVGALFAVLVLYGLFRPGEDRGNRWGPSLHPARKAPAQEVQAAHDITPETPPPANDDRKPRGPVRAEYDTTDLPGEEGRSGPAALRAVDPEKLLKKRRLT